MDDRITIEALRSFASIARELAAHPERASTSTRIAQLAVKLIGCDAANVSRLVNKRMVVQAGTDEDLAAVVESSTAGTGDSISMHACREQATLVCNDLQRQHRWAGAVRRGLADAPVRAVLALPLQVGSHNLGALTLYSDAAGYFAPALCDLARVYADHAAIALSLVTEHERVEHLHVALASNREIGAGIGIVMARTGLTSQAAFDLLRLVSQHTNRKIYDVARDVVTTRDVAVLTLTTAGIRSGPVPAQPITDQPAVDRSESVDLADSARQWIDVSDYRLDPAPAAQ